MAQHKLTQWLSSVWSRVGIRGLILGVTGAGMIFYGIGIFMHFNPVVILTGSLLVSIYRWVFIGVGCMCVVWAFFRDERLPYALAIGTMTGWSGVEAWYWNMRSGWTSAVPWLIIAAVLFICSWLPGPSRG